MSGLTRCILCAVGIVATVQATASDAWRSSAGLRSTLNFTDNVLLSQSDPESDVVLQLQPFLNSTWQSRLSSAQIAYGPEFVVYANHGDLNRNWQYLRAVGTTELVEDFVGLAVSAQANPTVANQTTPTAGFDPVANPNSYTQTASFSITPTIQFPIRAGSYATVQFNPNLNWVGYNSTDGGNGVAPTNSSTSVGSASTLNINSGSYFQRFPWSLNYTNTLFDPENSAGLGSVSATMGYILSRRYRVDLVLGYDDQYTGSGASAAFNAEGGGIRWQPRLTWTPNDDTTATFGVGEAYYGTDYYVNILRQQKRFVFGLTYNTVVQNARQAVLQQQTIPFQDAFGAPIVDPINSGQSNQVTSTPTLVEGTYVGRVLTGTLGFKGRRTTVTFNINATSYDYQISGEKSLQSYGSLLATHSINTKLSSRAEFLYQRNDYDRSSYDSWDQYRLAFGLVYQLGRKTTAGVTYSLSQGSSSNAGAGGATGGSPVLSGTGVSNGNYDENRLAFILSVQL